MKDRNCRSNMYFVAKDTRGHVIGTTWAHSIKEATRVLHKQCPELSSIHRTR